MVTQMRLNLLPILRNRPVIHPSRFERMISEFNGDLRFEISGRDWWLPEEEQTGKGTATLLFTSVGDCSLVFQHLHKDQFEEDYETLKILSLSDTPFLSGPNVDIYCSQPLENPFSLYGALHDFLREINCPHKADQYLNLGGSFRRFQEITSSQAYLLARGPVFVTDYISEWLRSQEHSFKQLPPPEMDDWDDDGLFVQIENCHFICQEAYLEF